MTLLISANNAYVVYEQALEAIQEHGHTVRDGDSILKELLGVVIEIKEPCNLAQGERDPKLNDMLRWMEKNFFSTEPVEGWGYSYGTRLVDYNGIDQIHNIVAKLQNNPDAKSATITFSNPSQDHMHMPCIISLDIKLREDKLLSYAFFRSQDAGKKIYADIICLGRIVQRIADELNVQVGKLVIFVASLHIYLEEFEGAMTKL